MWFKQAQLFQLTDSMQYSTSTLDKKLEELEFRECLPSLPYSAGWITPVDEENAPLTLSLNSYIMICLQIEEKILPQVVIQQELNKTIKKIESVENRKVRYKEKYALKDEITAVLLARAFSKLTKIYAYIDPKNQWLILGTANPKKAEQFLTIFKKTFGDKIGDLKIKKLSTIMTAWLKHQNYPSTLSIEKSCVLQDANHERRVIRCKEQDLFQSPIQSLIKDGCEIKQLAMNWYDRIDFVLLDAVARECAGSSHNLLLQSIKFKDEIILENSDETDSKQQQFNADFLLMSETFNGLFKELLDLVIEGTA